MGIVPSSAKSQSLSDVEQRVCSSDSALHKNMVFNKICSIKREIGAILLYKIINLINSAP
jgi:hypothetical protein